MYDIILKKRSGHELNTEEIAFFVEGYTKGDIPDYQASALLMAIFFNKMTAEETAILTDCMAKSGDIVDLSEIHGIKVDKHSTGGVGDKTTLIIAPIAAACGVPIAKMSGKGLGHTGGTIDKLEAIPGYKTELDRKTFIEIVKKIGISVIGQSGNIAPADKKIYALRDVTATVDNISLIASSIMSKKIASGADAIVLDVKAGSGAFMKTVDEAVLLAKEMVEIGELVGRKTIALITDMDNPLGHAIGNSLEVIEAVETLKGNGPSDLTNLCLELAANMVFLGRNGEVSFEKCQKDVVSAISSGAGYRKLIEMVRAQGGDVSYIENTDNFEKAEVIEKVVSDKSGYISKIETENVGLASLVSGAGRAKKEDSIDYSAGIVLHKKLGDYVEKGEIIAEIHTSQKEKALESAKILREAVIISDEKPVEKRLVLAKVSRNSVEVY